ncbi:xanthine dehydrogenase family protein subunit M [Gemmobacter fulvus]|uniref:FAD binding domain-containing protein n=1 Tax=Gemmobacter fulvus TaxID=2840474 RepID=UPI00279646A1|nr:xanthine dehydrogenase family protein subunit M [Gemmobacter fulvus]MDQ1850743.1 xanthine dehydrogenase family protein subunit M [Gemmobacter fulvus]
MRPPPFAYVKPEAVDEVLGLLTQYGDEARILSGGQSLLPLLNFRVAYPSYIIDINGLSDLDYLRDTPDGGLEIGGMTRYRTLETSAAIRDAWPILHEAIEEIGHVQIRNRGTIGGSLCHADPGAEMPTVVTALGGSVHLKSARGERKVAAGDFFVGQLTTSIEPDELLVAVSIPGWSVTSGGAWCEYAARKGDYGIVGVGAQVQLDAAGMVERVGLAVMNVGIVPFDATPFATPLMSGKVPDDTIIDKVAGEVAAAVQPNADIHATEAYRRHLTAVLVRRALGTAIARAQSKTGRS